MTARSFGRKNVIGEPAQRRAALVAHQPRSFRPAAQGLEPESEQPSGPSPLESLIGALKARRAAAPAAAPTDRSLKAAWPIWFLLGLAGGHRFYLRRPVSGALQAALFLGCLGAVIVAQRYEAFFGLGLSWLWMLVDGIRLKTLFNSAGRQ